MGLFRKLFIDRKVHENEVGDSPPENTPLEVIKETKKELDGVKKPSGKKSKK